MKLGVVDAHNKLPDFGLLLVPDATRFLLSSRHQKDQHNSGNRREFWTLLLFWSDQRLAEYR